MNLDQDLKTLIKDYERFLLSGERNQKELASTDSKNYYIQKAINSFWRTIIQDLKKIVDKNQYDSKIQKRRN